MRDFQVRYHFDSDGKETSGEMVIELVSAETAEDVARIVEQAMTQPTFQVRPRVGMAKDGGIVVLHTLAIRYVEVIPIVTGPITE